MPHDLFIHPERISDKPLLFEGTARLEDLPRLEESLANDDFELRYKVTARLDRQGRKVVSCIIEGFVFLTCQTTLEAFRHEVSIDDRLVLTCQLFERVGLGLLNVTVALPSDVHVPPVPGTPFLVAHVSA